MLTAMWYILLKCVDVIRIGQTLEGQTAEPGRYPYMASLRHPSTLENFCAGVLVAPAVVLTAAQCVEPNLGGAVKPVVHVGRDCTNCDSDVAGEDYEVANTLQSISHVLWNKDAFQGSDLAVLFLDTQLSSPAAKLLPASDSSM
eukprot:scaffold373296_cov40-Prasinocladus_malaysianus.AAC.1